EKLKAQVPLDLRFTNSAGESVALGDLLDGDKPVILTLNYSNCPMLCSIMLNGFVEGLGKMQWSVGEEFELITVSLDPDETRERALSTKERYLSDYGRKGAESGWHFLVGAENDVRTLADTVGFGYRYSEERKEYLHAAAAIVLTPKGEVSRYLYGITYSPKTMRLSLAEASDGKFASTIDQLILFCFHYDATVGRYAPVARNIMTLGGALTVLLLGLFLGGFWVKEARRSQI
ncbi:MAG: SCO family protein, partial [Myxococcota bacterium]